MNEKNISRLELDEILGDIAAIKDVIDRRRRDLHRLFAAPVFRPLYFVAGAGVIIHAFIWNHLVLRYGSYADIPSGAVKILWAVMIIQVVMQGIYKWVLAGRLRPEAPRWGMFLILRQMYSPRIIHVFGPVMASVIIAAVMMIRLDAAYFIIPAAAVSHGVLLNFFGSLAFVREYIIGGYWFLITGLITLIFYNIPAHIAVSLSIGLGFIIMGLVAGRKV
jgi:hypothetical protein